MRIVHVSVSANQLDVKVAEGSLQYGKEGVLSFRNYNVPDDFDITTEEGLTTLLKMYDEGLTQSDCGLVHYKPFSKKEFPKVL